MICTPHEGGGCWTAVILFLARSWCKLTAEWTGACVGQTNSPSYNFKVIFISYVKTWTDSDSFNFKDKFFCLIHITSGWLIRGCPKHSTSSAEVMALFIGVNELTYSMVQSPSWEANWFAASREIPRISQNLKVHYRTHKRRPPVSIVGQPNPVHIPTSHLLEIHPNIIHPSTPRSPQWSHSLRFPQKDPIHPPLLTHTSQMKILLALTQVVYTFTTAL